MRLIDADALSKRMYHDAFEVDSDMQRWDSGCWIRYKMFEKAIEDTPTIEPERKRGKWVHDGYDFPHGVDWIHCSICGKRGINVPADLTNFCSNCGADMRGEQDG